MTIRENMVIKPGIGEALIDRPHRVLTVDYIRSTATIIEIAGLKGEAGRYSKYARGPRSVDLSELTCACEEGRIVVTTYRAPEHWSMLDEEYIEAAGTEKEKERRRARLVKRDENWRLISPIVKDRPVRDIVCNMGHLRALIVKQAKCAGKNLTTVYRVLNVYLASGGVKNSLIPSTHRRGAPGVPKVHRKKLGRKSRLEESGELGGESYVLQDGDTERLAIGYRLISKTMREGDAYLITCAVYWSTLGEDGLPQLLPTHLRPTPCQFRYWGRKLSGSESRRRRLGLDRLAQRITPGSTQDQVCTVGQIAMLDSTTNDVYLTSLFSRLRKLPPMHVTILKEVRSTVVLGFYVGWEPPSTWTAHQAVLSGAENKVDICARFGISISDQDWPGMLCKQILADNGEFKSSTTTAAEQQFHFSVEYTKSWSGQSKSDVETQHHTHHKELNHKLPGTTGGKRRERGEKHPAMDAIWNYAEYMHEFLLMVIEYNNEEVVHLAPTAMLLDGIRPTRINILKWMMERNMRSDLPYDLERLRAFTMPPTKAVMTKRGIRLLMPDGRRHIPDIRFYAPELQDSAQFKQAVAGDCSICITIRQSETDTSRVWFALPGHGLTSIPNVSSDEDLRDKGTVVDLIQWTEDRKLAKDMQRGDEEQQDLKKLLRRQAKTNRGKAELAAELSAQGRSLSKTSIVRGLRKNRDAEMQALKSRGEASKEPRQECVVTPLAVAAGGHDAAASAAMESFMKRIAS